MTLPDSPIGCPMDALLRLLMGPWTSYILYVLRNNGPTRFGELKRQVGGISAKMLTERLRALEEGGVIYRHYEATIPPQVTYGLSARGKELHKVLGELDKIARRWNKQDGKPASNCTAGTPNPTAVRSGKKPPVARPERDSG